MVIPFIQQPLYEGAWLQVDRAKKHVAEFNSELQRFADSDPYSVVIQPELAPGLQMMEITVRETFPRNLAPIVGDAVHNLRSALNLLAYDLVRRETRREPPSNVQFPLASSSEHLERVIVDRGIHLAGPSVVRAVRELKPYTGGDDLLCALHDLDITGKHHSLIRAQWALNIHRGDPSINELLVIPHGYTKGVHPMPLGVPNDLPVNKELKPGIQIWFGPGPTATQGKEIAPTLVQFTELVSEIVRSFEKSFPTPAGFNVMPVQ